MKSDDEIKAHVEALYGWERNNSKPTIEALVQQRKQLLEMIENVDKRIRELYTYKAGDVVWLDTQQVATILHVDPVASGEYRYYLFVWEHSATGFFKEDRFRPATAEERANL